MRGIVVFLGLLLISSSVSAISLNADAVPVCLTQAGCSLDLLYTTLTGASATGLGNGDVVITSAQNAIVNVVAISQPVGIFKVDGNAIINVSQNAKLLIGTALAVSSKASLFVYGQVRAGVSSVDQTTTSTVNGVFVIAASGKAYFDNGLQLAVGSATSIGAGATLQIANTASVAQGAVTAAAAAVVVIVDTTVTLAGSYVATGQSYINATRATVEITASTTIGAILVLTENAQIQAQAAVSAVAGLAVTGLGNVIEVASGAVFSVKSEATIAAEGALTTVRYIIYEYRLHVDGVLILTKGNGTATPTFYGGITAGLGSHINVSVNTGLIAQAQTTISGTLTLLAGASYQATAAAQTIVTLVIAGAGVLIAAAQASAVLIQQYTVVVAGTFQTLGSVTYGINN